MCPPKPLPDSPPICCRERCLSWPECHLHKDRRSSLDIIDYADRVDAEETKIPMSSHADLALLSYRPWVEQTNSSENADLNAEA